MSVNRVLWIEDNADNDLHHLTSPVVIDGRYDLEIARNASEAIYHLNERPFDIVIVDIRIPPGRDQEWRSRQDKLREQKSTNSNRLGLELLRTIFGENGPKSRLRIAQNRVPERYGVFTVERMEEIRPELEQMRLKDLKYKRKNAIMSNTALLNFIDEIYNGIDKENGKVKSNGHSN